MVATVDKFGRIIIPEKVRKQFGITSETNLNIEPVRKKELIIENDGTLVFTGKLHGEIEVSDDRAQRMNKLSNEI